MEGWGIYVFCVFDLLFYYSLLWLGWGGIISLLFLFKEEKSEFRGDMIWVGYSSSRVDVGFGVRVI